MSNKYGMRYEDKRTAPLILANGWRKVWATGSHYVYEKDGFRYPVPYHGAKEIGKGLEKKIKREMGLK